MKAELLREPYENPCPDCQAKNLEKCSDDCSNWKMHQLEEDIREKNVRDSLDRARCDDPEEWEPYGTA